MKEYPKIILTRPKLVLDTCCPKCHSHDIVALPALDIKCRKCQSKFNYDPLLNIYASIAKKINVVLGSSNGINILGPRETSSIIHSEDFLKPKTKLEDDVYHAFLEIQKNFKDMGCWEVGEIAHDYDLDFKTHCKDCGYCKSCVTCNKCGTKYTGSKDACPKCASKSRKDSVVDKFKKDGKSDVCPFCNSPNVAYTSFNNDKKQCPKCGSKNLHEPKKIAVYRLTVERQKRNWKANE